MRCTRLAASGGYRSAQVTVSLGPGYRPGGVHEPCRQRNKTVLTGYTPYVVCTYTVGVGRAGRKRASSRRCLWRTSPSTRGSVAWPVGSWRSRLVHSHVGGAVEYILHVRYVHICRAVCTRIDSRRTVLERSSRYEVDGSWTSATRLH